MQPHQNFQAEQTLLLRPQRLPDDLHGSGRLCCVYVSSQSSNNGHFSTPAHKGPEGSGIRHASGFFLLSACIHSIGIRFDDAPR